MTYNGANSKLIRLGQRWDHPRSNIRDTLRAAGTGDKPMVQLLLKHKTKLNPKDYYDRSTMNQVSDRLDKEKDANKLANYEKVKLLLEKELNVVAKQTSTHVTLFSTSSKSSKQSDNYSPLYAPVTITHPEGNTHEKPSTL